MITEGTDRLHALMDHLPRQTFHRLVQRDQVDNRVKAFMSTDQFLCTTFARLTYLDSLRDIEHASEQYPRTLPSRVPDPLRSPSAFADAT